MEINLNFKLALKKHQQITESLETPTNWYLYSLNKVDI